MPGGGREENRELGLSPIRVPAPALNVASFIRDPPQRAEGGASPGSICGSPSLRNAHPLATLATPEANPRPALGRGPRLDATLDASDGFGVTCGECGTNLLPGKKFCHACGARASATCPSCGTVVEPGFQFCPDCGEALNTEPAPATADSARAGGPPPEDRLTRLSRHIPDSLARKLRSAGTAAGERKRVTVLFCDLVGSTEIAEALDPEEYRELLEQYLEVTIAEIYRFEGIVNQLAGDGLMALFGAPIAHEDAPERAVRAALGLLAPRSR